MAAGVASAFTGEPRLLFAGSPTEQPSPVTSEHASTPASTPAPAVSRAAPAVSRAALADRDPNNDSEVAPPARIEGCEDRLRAAGIEFRAANLKVQTRRNGATCGCEQAVIYRRSVHGIRYNSSPLLSCGMALALADFEAIVTEEALRHFGERVVSIAHAGTYSCRQMARFQSLVSEHSYANAIDIKSFRLTNGRTISVLRHFSKLDTAESRFLHALAQRLYDEDAFSVVLTEYFDRLHRDHFHLDLARYRVDGTR